MTQAQQGAQPQSPNSLRQFRLKEGARAPLSSWCRPNKGHSHRVPTASDNSVSKKGHEHHSAHDAGPTRGTATVSQQPTAALSPGVERPRQCCPSHEGLLTQGIGLQGWWPTYPHSYHLSTQGQAWPKCLGSYHQSHCSRSDKSDDLRTVGPTYQPIPLLKVMKVMTSLPLPGLGPTYHQSHHSRSDEGDDCLTIGPTYHQYNCSRSDESDGPTYHQSHHSRSDEGDDRLTLGPTYHQSHCSRSDPALPLVLPTTNLIAQGQMKVMTSLPLVTPTINLIAQGQTKVMTALPLFLPTTNITLKVRWKWWPP